MTAFVSYLRVSTKEQGRSGLGLEAQREAVASFLAQEYGTLAHEFIEIESGKRADRPKLSAALAMCRVMGARLVVAKLDRLARNVHFVSGLMESGVDFVAADMPSVNRLTIHVVAAVAEEEARAISKRTKEALAAAKARKDNPVKLGGRRKRTGTDEYVMALDDAARAKAVEARSVKASAKAADLLPIILEIKAEALREGRMASLAGIAKTLTERRVKTPNGGSAWQAVQVSRIMARA